MRLDGKGNLVFQLGGSALRQLAPRVYQEVGGKRRPVAGRFVLHGKRVAFALGAYDHSRMLVIDPVLVYSTYLGGSELDDSYGIAVDAGGSAYVSGVTFSTDFPTEPASPLQAANAGGSSDAFIAKLNTAGTALVYSTYLGGSSLDDSRGIAVDAVGNAYLTGFTDSIDFPTASPLQAAFAGSYDAFIAKLDATGTALIYSTYLGGSGGDYSHGIAVDADGSAYLTGSTDSTDLPTAPASPVQAANAGGSLDAFVAKLDAAGTALVYSTYLGGSGLDEGLGIAVDRDGSAYVSGFTDSTNFPTASPLQAANAGGGDAFVTKLNPAGTALVYSTYLGGSGSESDFFGPKIAVDAAKSAYLTGATNSTDFPTAPLIPLQLLNAGSGDAFVTKLNAAGTALVYSAYLGGSGGDTGFGIAVDAAGSAYLTGTTGSMNFPTAPVIPLQMLNGSGDAFVTKLDAAGTALVYSTYLGGSGGELGFGIAVDAGGSAYLTGNTNSTDFPTAPASPLQAANTGGLMDAFVTKVGGTATAVRLLSFTARHSAPGVVLRWRTAAGARLLGVNVYRGNKRLNRRLLEASGGFLDRSARRGITFTYRLQAVALDGTRLWLATATAA